MTDVSGSILEISPSPAGAGLYLNYPHMGFYDNSEFTAFISASGGFLFKADDNNLISFGQSVSGGDGSSTKSFVLKSDNVFLSGSKVNILGERFFLGGSSQFVSGSGGNIEISSSKFHIQPDGDVVMNNITASNALISGNITITGGSAKSALDSLGDATASLQSSVTTLGTVTASLNSATASLQTNIDNVEANVSGAFNSTSASIASDLNTVESNISGAFTSVSESIVSTISEVSSSTALRIMTDATGSILDIPASPSGEGLYLNYPYMGFYGIPTITDTTYVVTANGTPKYLIDGVQQATVELQVGYTYRFDTSHGSMGSHPFRFSTDSGNSSQYTTGVTVGSGYVDIVVTSSTPSTLYYYCTNHPNMGGQINVVNNSEFKAFISASGGFLFKADENNLISFGQSVSGGDGSSTKSFVLKSDNVFLSGSKVNILGERFFLGGQSQFISGSGGNLEISSSAFHLDPANNTMTLSGSITATDGTIGGMNIATNTIESTADAGDGSTITYAVTANGNSNYIILGQSNPTLTLIPGNTYRFGVSDDTNAGHPFRFTESDGGTDYYTTGVTINGTVGDPGAYVQIVVTQNTPNTLYYRCTNHVAMRGTLNIDKTSPLILDGNTGQITGSRVLFEGGKIGGAILTSGSISSGTSGYENDGFYLDSGGKFSLGNKLSWNGSSLSLEGAINITSGVTANQLADLNSETGSLQSSVTTLGEATASLQSSITTLGQATASLQSATGSLQTNIDNVEANVSGAFAEASASLVNTIVTVSSSVSERIMTDISGSILSTPPAPSGEGLFLNFPHMGYYSGSAYQAFISASGGFLFKADDNNLISFGQSVSGGDGVDTKSFVLKSDNVFLSGSSNFHLKNNGDAIFKGDLTGASGTFSGTVNVGGTNLTTDNTLNANTSKTDVGLDQVQNLNAQNQAQSGLISGTTITGGGITLSNGGNIKGGQTNFNTGTGFFLGYANSNYQFSIGHDDGNRLTWDGSNLIVSSSTFVFGGRDQFISGSNGLLEISSSNFHLDTDGSVTMQGTITADDGEIGGFTIINNTLTAGSGTTSVTLDSANSKLKIGNKQSLNDDKTGIHVGTDGIALGANSPFKVTAAGALTARNADIGSFEITAGAIKSPNGALQLIASGSDDGQIIRLGAALLTTNPGPDDDILTLNGQSVGANAFRISIGSPSDRPVQAPFRVSGSGHMFATAATIGNVTSGNALRAGSAGIHHINNVLTISASFLNLSGSESRATFDSTASFQGPVIVNSTSSFQGPVTVTGSFLKVEYPFGGGGESGVIIDSSNVGSQEAALTFKNDAESYMMGVNDNDTFYLHRSSSLPENTTDAPFAFKPIIAGSATNLMYLNAATTIINGGTSGGNGMLIAGGQINMTGDVISDGSGSFGHIVASTTNNSQPGTLTFKSTDGSIETDDVFGQIVWTTRTEDSTTQRKVGRIHVEARSGNFDNADRPARMVFSVSENDADDFDEIFFIQYASSTNPASFTINEEAEIVKSLAVGNITPSGTAGRIDAQNDVVAFSSSDIRFKKNTTPIQDALFKIKQLQGVEFDWIPNKEHHGHEGHDVGVIAQEVEKVLPEIVQTRDSGYKAVKYEKMIPLLIEGIKEQQEQIDELKKEVEELKNGNN